MLIFDREEFKMIIKDIANHPTVLEMKNFRQHYDTSCYDHCQNVAYYSYLFCKKFKLDYEAVARAGMLHDLFLYDWRVRQPGRKGHHAFTHSKTSYEKASHLFEFNKKEKDIILKHMWPVTIIPPKYIESYILTLVDKYSALTETFTYISKKMYTKKIYKFATFILPILLIHLP